MRQAREDWSLLNLDRFSAFAFRNHSRLSLILSAQSSLSIETTHVKRNPSPNWVSIVRIGPFQLEITVKRKAKVN